MDQDKANRDEQARLEERKYKEKAATRREEALLKRQMTLENLRHQNNLARDGARATHQGIIRQEQNAIDEKRHSELMGEKKKQTEILQKKAEAADMGPLEKKAKDIAKFIGEEQANEMITAAIKASGGKNDDLGKRLEILEVMSKAYKNLYGDELDDKPSMRDFIYEVDPKIAAAYYGEVSPTPGPGPGGNEPPPSGRKAVLDRLNKLGAQSRSQKPVVGPSIRRKPATETLSPGYAY